MNECLVSIFLIPAKVEDITDVIADLEKGNIFEFWTVFFEEVKVREQ